jgi:hypothetical protein
MVDRRCVKRGRRRDKTGLRSYEAGLRGIKSRRGHSRGWCDYGLCRRSKKRRRRLRSHERTRLRSKGSRCLRSKKSGCGGCLKLSDGSERRSKARRHHRRSRNDRRANNHGASDHYRPRHNHRSRREISRGHWHGNHRGGCHGRIRHAAMAKGLSRVIRSCDNTCRHHRQDCFRHPSHDLAPRRTAGGHAACSLTHFPVNHLNHRSSRAHLHRFCLRQNRASTHLLPLSGLNWVDCDV